MPATEATTVPAETAEPIETGPPPTAETKRKPRTETRTKRQPPHVVLLHNDDINGMDHVVGALRKVFNYGRMKSITLMLKAHVTGRAAVWTGSLEVAEFKADQLKSCGADPRKRTRGALPLRVSVEPLPQ
ncbi:MAG: ATP-dependent Clp protease adaptor ClpS [Planctomycetota bacterium]|nr:ATP-dependent Clp protease adaptor ClpS [Planctomycetota bacterium]